MIIENYKLKEFIIIDRKKINEYLIALRYLKPRDTARRVFDMKLKHVEMIKKKINSGNDIDLIKIVSKVQKITTDEVFELKIIEFFGFVNSIRKQIEQIINAEKNAFENKDINPKWEMVRGNEKMSKFGIYNTLDKLTRNKPHLYKKYMNMQYVEIFTILLKWQTEAILQKEMDKIKI